MKFATATNQKTSAGFTLAEVLAALLFLAIVIPAAIEAMHVATLAGDVAARKGSAARVAEKVLNESIVLTNWNGGGQSGTVTEGAVDYHWKLTQQTWTENDFQLLTAQVTFSAQGKDYGVKISTLATADVQTPGQAMTVH